MSSLQLRAKARAKATGESQHIFQYEDGFSEIISDSTLEDMFADGEITEYEYRRDCLRVIHPKEN